MISKVIVNRIQPFLNEVISPEQFGFILGCQVSDDIGITQEVLHYLQVKKCFAFILKLDLNKEFDKVHWDKVCLILLHIGLPLNVVNWITTCISSSIWLYS